MLNKNDPLIGAVQEVMKRNQAERNATKLVNEKFGVTDRKAIPHERQHEWDSAYAKVLNEGINVPDVSYRRTEKNGNSDRTVMTKDTKNVFSGGTRTYQNLDKSSDGTTMTTKIKSQDLGRNKELGGKDYNVSSTKVYKKVDEESLDEKMLVGNQPKLDVASSTGEKKPDGKLTSHDFKHLRAKKKTMEEDMTSPSSMGIKKPNYAPAGTTPDYAKPTTQTVNRGAKTSMPAGTVKEENLEEKAVSVAQRNLMGAALSVKRGGKPISPQVAKVASNMSTSELRKFAGTKEKGLPKKKMKIDEGFNNRHGLSVTASAKKQAVTDHLSEAGINPILMQQRQKKLQQATANRNMTDRIQAREPKQPSSFERFQSMIKANPPKVIGGSPVAPLGGPAASVARTVARAVPGIASRVYNSLRGGSSGQSANLAAGAARRQPGQSVPQIRQQRPSSGSNLPSGPWGSIARRGGDARAATGRGSPSGTFAARLQASRQAQQSRVGGNTVGANQAAARTRMAQQSQQGRVGTNTTAATQAGSRARMAQQAQGARAGTNTTAATQAAARTRLSQVVRNMRNSGGSEGARRVTQTAFAADTSSSRSVQPKTAQAGNVKDQSRIAPGTSSADQQRGAEQDKVGVKRTQVAPVGVTARKIEATPRKVSDTEIMNSSQYKQAVNDVGGEKAARQIKPGRDVAGVGTVAKGETIWSKVKSQLEKQPVKGFEAGANKGGAGR